EGETWRPTTDGTPYGRVLALAIDPKNSQTIYAATTTGLIKSVNAGVSWMSANAGLPSQPVLTIAIDPSNPAIIWPGQFRESLEAQTRVRAGYSTVFQPNQCVCCSSIRQTHCRSMREPTAVSSGRPTAAATGSAQIDSRFQCRPWPSTR